MIDIVKYIDHTALKPETTARDIEKLCTEARQYHFASVCVNSQYVRYCNELLRGAEVNICTVIGFPLGACHTDVKAFEVMRALEDGCDEFDMVIPIGALKEGRKEYVKQDIERVAVAAQGRIVKVIIETALLTEEEKIRAVRIACDAGAHYVKTCTGFGGGAATVEDVALMAANCIGGVKVKASGGIKTYEQAAALIEAGASRIGTSAGMQILKEIDAL